MNNFVQPGNTLSVIAPAAVKSGEVVQVASLIGVAATDAEAGAEVEVSVEGVYALPKATADAVTPGVALYWDAAAGKATVTAGTGSKPVLGYATAAAGAGVTSVRVKFTPGVATGPA